MYVFYIVGETEKPLTFHSLSEKKVLSFTWQCFVVAVISAAALGIVGELHQAQTYTYVHTLVWCAARQFIKQCREC